MSASKEKKRRQAQLETQEPAAKGKKPKKEGALSLGMIFACIGVAVLVLLAIFFAFSGGSYLERHVSAATVGKNKVSPVLYNYFYGDVYGTVANELGLTDASADLTQMPYGTDGKTYADYLNEEVDRTIAETYALYDQGKADGLTLTDADRNYINSAVQMQQLYASYAQAPNLDAYLQGRYGKGSSEKTYTEYAEIMQYASACSTAYAKTLNFSDEELSTYYADHKADLDTVSYHAYLCAVNTDEKDAAGNAVVDMAASQALAEEIAAAGRTGLDAFNAQVAAQVTDEEKASYENGSATRNANKLVADIPASLATWLFDESRKAGDTTAIVEGESGCYAVYFVDNSAKYDTDMVSVRHLLIEPETADDEASVTAAHQKAAALLEKYQAGEMTEEAFAALAKENSADVGSAANGGLIENVYPGSTVQSFNDWCFDATRKAGDTGLVDSDYGTHVIYFVGVSGNYQQYRILTALRGENANAWAEELGAGYTVKHHALGMKQTGK